jgi:hypothetical protein
VLASVLELVYALVGPAVRAEKALVPLQQFLQHAQQEQEQEQNRPEALVWNMFIINRQKYKMMIKLTGQRQDHPRLDSGYQIAYLFCQEKFRNYH